jgi:hypothetical protein
VRRRNACGEVRAGEPGRHWKKTRKGCPYGQERQGKANQRARDHRGQPVGRYFGMLRKHRAPHAAPGQAGPPGHALLQRLLHQRPLFAHPGFGPHRADAQPARRARAFQRRPLLSPRGMDGYPGVPHPAHDPQEPRLPYRPGGQVAPGPVRQTRAGLRALGDLPQGAHHRFLRQPRHRQRQGIRRQGPSPGGFLGGEGVRIPRRLPRREALLPLRRLQRPLHHVAHGLRARSQESLLPGLRRLRLQAPAGAHQRKAAGFHHSALRPIHWEC